MLTGLLKCEEIDWETVTEALKDLRGLFEVATSAEKKELLSTFIREIRIPRKGAALLEANPTGLLRSSGVPLSGDPEGNRTPVTGVKGRCPNR